jgi:hypothetical protein
MPFQVGDSVWLNARDLAPPKQDALRQANQLLDIATARLDGKLVGRPPSAPRSWLVDVAEPVGRIVLATSKLTAADAEPARTGRNVARVNYAEGDESEPEIDDAESDGSCDTSDLPAPAQPAQPAAPNTGPVTAANAKVSDWEEVESVNTDQRAKAGHDAGLVQCAPPDPWLDFCGVSAATVQAGLG